MSERDMKWMEQTLQEDLPLAEAVTPWGRAMRQILWGIGLTTLTVEVLYLQYILPTVGVILLVLGFRTLRRENVWMRRGWIVSLIRAAWRLFAMVDLALGLLPEGVTWVSVVLDLLQTVCLWRGLAAVRAKAGQEAKAPAGGWLLVWEIVMIPLGLARVSGWLPVLLMMAVWILVLRSLVKLSHTIDEAGYAVAAAPVRVSAPVLLWGYLGCMAAAVALCLLLGGRYPMTWTPRETAQDTVAAAHLRRMGMPEEILNDLAPEDLELLADAVALHVGEASRGNMVSPMSHEEDPLELRTVVAEMPADTGQRWIVLHYFRWKTDPAYRGTDCLAAGWNAFNNASVARDEAVPFTGRVLCDRDGVTWVAPYHEVREERYTYTTWFSSEERRDMLADFSSLRGGSNLRGYLLCGVIWTGEKDPQPEDVVMFCVYYHHQFRPEFPALDARTHVRGSVGSSGGPYQMGVDILYYPLQNITDER